MKDVARMTSKWHWAELPPLGGAAGGLASKIFRGIEQLDTADLLAREVIQNSWDAARKLRAQLKKPDLPFEMVFRFVSLSGKEKDLFLEQFNLASIREQSKHMKKRSAEKSNEAFSKVFNQSTPLRILFCEDYGAHGLYGPIDKPSTSILFKALYMFGDTDKGEDQGSGGSYGFGKSAFIQGSGIKTVLAYSAFLPFEDDPTTRRFLGFSYWDNFNIKDSYFDGRAIYGNNSKRPGLPFEDKDADREASKVGFTLRNGHEHQALGTSLALISPQIDANSLMNAIEKWWWPALIDNQMQIRVVHEDGTVAFPRPLRNQFTKPFLQAYSIAKGEVKASEASKEMLVSSGWQKSQGIKIGEFALRMLDDEETQFEEETEGNFPTIAVMRNPKMIVEYKTYERRRLPVRGVFIASQEADEFLKLSEPAQHDHWDTKPVSDANDKEVKAALIARSVDDQLKKGLARFIEQISPPSPRDRQVLTLFADLMSGLLSGKKTGPTPPPPNSKMPFEIQFVEPAMAEAYGADKVRTRSQIQVSLSPNAKEKEYLVKISFDFTITEEEDQKGDPWPVNVSVLSKSSNFTQESSRLIGILDSKSKIQIQIVSDPYDPNWTALLKPKVEVHAKNGKGD